MSNDYDRKKASFLFITIISLVIVVTGCFGPTPEANWNEVVTSYDYNKNKFIEFEDDVVIGDTVDNLEYLSAYAVTKVTLRSNSIPLYLQGEDVSDVDDSDNDLTDNFNDGDDIVFIIHFKEDSYGEYISEMSRNGK
ncbi:hypothetical protein AKJ51_01380 [candidate division MSBL1 archaeon SCGC-AAA382A20]|uniref:Uncharacterized protein n=1 Tax=candidate division MSBL1 archaeon SCGC-AAA382A20 TaxID=1698280 RepID=A0A133VLP9_9EURY|nr:hypothetical protein AKJ51_01380 [candidate division MSBL1 archaeon SCGC-AAA382A20]